MGEAALYLYGQYLIVNGKENLKGLPLIPFDEEVEWNGLTLLKDASLPLSRASSKGLSILVLGMLMHHEYHEWTDQDVLLKVAAESRNIDDAIRLLHGCGGRYMALIRNKAQTVAITDSCAMRHVYWYSDEKNLILSSSPRLILDSLDQRPQLEEKVSALLGSRAFLEHEHSWFGDTWYDSRIKKLLANHYLDLGSLAVGRTKYTYEGPTADKEIIPYATGILRGLIRTAHHRYRVIQPLTAGYDSRLLLAASRPFSDKTRYFVFAGSQDLNRCPDVKIATQLAKMLHLNFEVILPGKLRNDFAAQLGRKCFFPRVLPKSAHIQWHYDTGARGQLININGNCAEVGRHYKPNLYDSLKDLVKYSGLNGFFAPQIAAWYDDAIDYCRSTGITVFGLFYWEQRMSNWGAQFPFEQDVALDEFTPYNQKNLLHALLKVDLKRRSPPHFPLFRDMIDHLWPETLSLPFNPIVGVNIKSRLRKLIMG